MTTRKINMPGRKLNKNIPSKRLPPLNDIFLGVTVRGWNAYADEHATPLTDLRVLYRRYQHLFYMRRYISARWKIKKKSSRWRKYAPQQLIWNDYLTWLKKIRKNFIIKEKKRRNQLLNKKFQHKKKPGKITYKGMEAYLILNKKLPPISQGIVFKKYLADVMSKCITFNPKFKRWVRVVPKKPTLPPIPFVSSNSDKPI